MVKKALTLALFAVTSCRPEPSDTVIDQCARAKTFHECMAELPAGPVEAKYNDWDEVVSQCDTTAMYQSLRKRHAVKPECAVEWP